MAYLEAMGIDVWRPRSRPLGGGPAQSGARLIELAEGEGDILCIARSREESRQKLAVDISGAMRTAPIWCWPAGESCVGPEFMSLEAAVKERLLTRILVFGGALAETLFDAGVPDLIASARVHAVPGLDRLDGDRDAKRKLWGLMCEQGIAAGKTTGTQQGRTPS
jgi:hypothetical protein